MTFSACFSSNPKITIRESCQSRATFFLPEAWPDRKNEQAEIDGEVETLVQTASERNFEAVLKLFPLHL